MMRVIPSTISARTSWCTATPRERKPGGPFWAFPINGATVPLPSSWAPGAGAESRAALLRHPPEPERTAAL